MQVPGFEVQRGDPLSLRSVEMLADMGEGFQGVLAECGHRANHEEVIEERTFTLLEKFPKLDF